MAQLDSLTYSSQIIWTMVVFFCLYMYFLMYLFPLVYRYVSLSSFIIERLLNKMCSFGRLWHMVRYSLYWWLLGLGSIFFFFSYDLQSFFEVQFGFYIRMIWLYFQGTLWLMVLLSGMKYKLVS